MDLDVVCLPWEIINNVVSTINKISCAFNLIFPYVSYHLIGNIFMCLRSDILGLYFNVTFITSWVHVRAL